MIPQINLIQTKKQIKIQQGGPKIIIDQVFPKITIVGTNNMLNILPFSLIATSNGQKVFTLPYNYKTIICLFVMGTGQDVIAGDYSVNWTTLIMGPTAPALQIGDLVFGAGQL